MEKQPIFVENQHQKLADQLPKQNKKPFGYQEIKNQTGNFDSIEQQQSYSTQVNRQKTDQLQLKKTENQSNNIVRNDKKSLSGQTGKLQFHEKQNLRPQKSKKQITFCETAKLSSRVV